MIIKREYLVLIGVIVLMSSASGIAMWAGVFTNPKIEIKESTCDNMRPSIMKSFNDAAPSAWKPNKIEIKEIIDTHEASPVKGDNGLIAERRCRGNAIMADGSRTRVNYKIFEKDGATVYLAGLDQNGEVRIFRRD